MKRLGISLILATSAIAQNALWVDLSGEWRMSTGDRPEYAAANYDDSAWKTVNLPWRAAPPVGFYWLRRTADLPPGTDAQELAVTLGAIADAYELYINGQLAGKTGGLSIPEAEVARPRTFEFPASTERGRIVIAVRLLRIDGQLAPGNATWRRYSDGPYAIHNPGHVPEDYGAKTLSARQWQVMPEMSLSVVQVLISAVLAVFWLSERRRIDLLWLSLCLGADAAMNSSTVFLLSPDAHPWGQLWRTAWIVPLRIVFLAEFVVWVFNRRQLWVQILIGICGVTMIMAKLSNQTLFRPPADALYLLIGGVIVASYWRPPRDFTRLAHHGLAALLAAWTLFLANRIALQFGLPGRFEVGGFQVLPASLMGAIFALFIALIVLSQLLRQRRRLASELEAARTMQQLLLPAESAARDVDAVYWPAQEVGGDFWQALPSADGGLLVVAGDVSGKGLGAAMVVSMMVGALRNRKSDQPAEILGELNRVAVSALRGAFVTAIVAHLSESGVAIASAGHPSPYMNGVELIVASGLPLGIDPGAEYEESNFALSGPLTLVSDGVIEAANAKGELFGFERTRKISTKSAKEIANTAKSWGQNDDITVVTIHRLASPQVQS